jgi:glycosyltransferase involved in cell wall biosynthesis
MRICFICPEYPAGPHGGIGTYTQLTARGLVKLGHEVRVIGVYTPSYPAPDFENDEGVKVYRLRTKSGKFGWIPAWIKQYRIIKRWVDDNLIDIVEAPDSRGWYAFWPKLRKPLVLRFHGSQTFIAATTHKTPNKLTNYLEKLTYKRADALCSVSNYNAQVTSKLFNIEKNIVVIFNGVEYRKLNRTSRNKNNIVFAGTLNTFKGFKDFLDAIAILASQEFDFTVDIYGKDAILDNGQKGSEYILEVANKFGLNDKLRYHGNVTREELFRSYENASVAVCPSHVESFGLAPVEAMLCECPVIFTNNSTGKEIIEDEIDGILVSPFSPIEIKNAIVKILSDPLASLEMGKRARQNVLKKFNLEDQLTKNLEFYNATIKCF